MSSEPFGAENAIELPSGSLIITVSTALTTHAKGQHLILTDGVYRTLALFATPCKNCGNVKITRGTTSLVTFAA
jgi:hypothetical protein